MARSTADNQVKAAGAVAQTYARSLMELAEEAGGEVPAQIGDELGQLVGLLDEHPDLAALFANPGIHARRRARSIEAIFKGRLSDLLYRFLQVLNDKGRLGYLAAVRTAFDQMLKARRGEIDVDLYTAHPLEQSQIATIRERLSQSLGRTALVSSHVDPSLIGGLRIRIGDRLLDGSVATQLQQLNRQLKARGREAARRAQGQGPGAEGQGQSGATSDER